MISFADRKLMKSGAKLYENRHLQEKKKIMQDKKSKILNVFR